MPPFDKKIMNTKKDNGIPNNEIDVRKTFDIDVDLNVTAYKEANEALNLQEQA